MKKLNIQWIIVVLVFSLLIIFAPFAKRLGMLVGSKIYHPSPVPVLVQSRNGLSGEVAIFNSFYTNKLSVEATFNNITFHQTKTYDLVLEPGESQEIGWAQG